MSIKLPEVIQQKLALDHSLNSAVLAAIADFTPWLESRMCFFPDYSDHGSKHVGDVLRTSVSLMSDDSHGIITPQDAAVLVLAVILHDSAMHLTEEGFASVVAGEYTTDLILPFDTTHWPRLWDEYIFEATRWDARMLVDVLGEAPESGCPYTVRRPPLDKLLMDSRDHRIIGEFIRRHHHRLAHEIALWGVPGPTANRLALDARLDSDYRNIVGLVARSHGMPIRACLDYLNDKGGKREFRQVHVVYLMSLLRVGDYLQVQAERAPQQLLKVKEVRSPISRREWNAHQAVKDINQVHDDPEAVVIRADPSYVKTFLRLREWLTGIQAELDASWAVLGEVYGRYEPLDELGIIIRRVRSNLDDVEHFAKSVDYVPDRVEFDVARPELLKLLVRPLYGNQPEIGIRELIQNAVDAVRERQRFQEHHPAYAHVDLIEQDADVVVHLDDPDECGAATLTISDRGIGMTEGVIRDYFLKVGATYRRSKDWQREFERSENESTLHHGLRSEVLRSGRFGVGALAAFLLGSEIEVETRHITECRGIAFKTSLDTELIELRYRGDLPVGTTIRLRIASPDVSVLTRRRTELGQPMDKWDWYCFSTPSLSRVCGKNRHQLTSRWQVPSPGEPLRPFWRCAEHGDFEAIHWTYSDGPWLTCNGLVVDTERIHMDRITKHHSLDRANWRTITDCESLGLITPRIVCIIHSDVAD